MSLWTDADILKSQEILRKYTVDKYHDALKEIQKVLKKKVSPGALRAAFLRKEVGSPTTFCAEPGTNTSKKAVHVSAVIQQLISCTKKGPISFEELCNKMQLPPGKMKVLLEEARASGVSIHIEHNHVGIKHTNPDMDQTIKSVGIAPVIGGRHRVAVISDTHLGSKYCLREQMQEFIQYAYDSGIREVLHPGDVLDGMYRHGLFEVSHTGLDEQARDLFETLPQLPGLNYRCITGNHDYTFTESIGLSVGQYLTNYFRDRGRTDIHFYGDRSAFLKIYGAVIHLWHPRSGVSYARSYAVQKQIEKYSSGVKPNVLLCGHWHIFVHCFERGVHGIACPTFQGGGSAFGKSLGGSPAIGGLILSWGLTEHGTMREFNLDYRAYFEKEKLVQLDGFMT